MASFPLVPLAAVVLLGATAAGALTPQELSPALARLSPSDFVGRASVESDSRQQLVTLSTRSASTREGPSREVLVDDAHARAVVDLKADRVSFQVWHEFSYNGDLAEIAAVHYPVGSARHRAAPQGVEQWRSTCGPADWSGSCFLSTRVVFELPVEHVRAIAESHAHQSRNPWTIQFEDRTGKVVTVGFAPAELAGLVQAYEAWTAGKQ